MVKVSVIIPVYNTAEYLRKSIGSVLSQTLMDLEVVAVDNGSTDGSENILRHLAAEDERIHVYSQPIAGVAAARNEALSHVNGKYLYFLDSDDELLPNALETCFDKCEKGNLDFITFDAEKLVEGNDCVTVQDYDRRGSRMDGKVWKGEDLLDYQMAHGAFRGSLWLMFCRADFVKSFFNRFAEGYIHEDQLFVVSSYIYAKRVEYLPLMLYQRRVRPDSIMTKTFSMRNVYGYRQAVNDVCNIKGHEATIRKWREMTVNAVVWQCHSLTIIEKIKTIFIFIFPNIRYINFRNIGVFLLKR